MPDVQLRGTIQTVTTDVTTRVGGPIFPAEDMSSADQDSIHGNGTWLHPLEGDDGIVVHNDSLIGDGTTESPLGVAPDQVLASLVLQALALAPSLTPPALPAGETDNYAPPGFTTTTLMYQATASAGSALTGLDIDDIEDGDVRIIHNNGDGLGAGELTLVHESSESVAANRFNLPGFKDVVIPVHGAAVCCYSVALGRWTIWSLGDAFARLYVRNFNLNGEITPAALPTGVTQDWAPVDAINPAQTFKNNSVVRVVVPTAGASLGGLDATGIQIGDVRILVNHGDGSGSLGVSELTLIERDTGSLVANRFVLPNLSTLVIPYTGACFFRYDAPASGWIPVAISVGGRLRRINAGALTLVSQAVTLAAGNNNNFNPLDGDSNPLLAYTSYFRLTPDAGGSTITGIELQTDGAVMQTGQVVVLENAVGNVPIVFENQSLSSDPGNRFSFPAGSFALPPRSSLVVIYNFALARWVPLGQLSAFSKLTYSQRIDDLALGAAVNDYNPTGFSYIGRLRLASAGSTNISGMEAQEDGAERVLQAYSGGITLLHQSVLSGPANRFFLPSGSNYAIAAGGSARCTYDAAFGGWLLNATA